jgi:hypothetical protein
MLLVPAFRFTVIEPLLTQVVQAPVTGKLTGDTAVEPFTISIALRSPEALAKRQASVYEPAAAAFTLQFTPLPLALVVLAKPAPVKPALLLSTVPSTPQKPVVFS